MKHFKRNSWAILPLLSVLSMSPADLEKNFNHRSIASVEKVAAEVVNEENPRYQALISKVDRASLPKNENITLEDFQARSQQLNEKYNEEVAKWTDPAAERVELDRRKAFVEQHVIEVLALEQDLSVLKEKGLIPEGNEDIGKFVLDQPANIEGLLSQIENDEKVIAEAQKPQEEEQPEVVVKEPKAEEEQPEVVVEEPKSEEDQPEVVVEEEPKAEEEQPEVVAEEDFCEQDDRFAQLTTQIEAMLNTQNQILQAMMGMNQTMMAMMQQQAWNPYLHGSLVPYAHQYQYSNPGSSWNYQGGNTYNFYGGMYPDQLGSQPSQQSAMVLPQGQLQIEPQGYNGWGLAPEFQLPMQVMPGSFGGLPQMPHAALGFPMSPMPLTAQN